MNCIQNNLLESRKIQLVLVDNLGEYDGRPPSADAHGNLASRGQSAILRMRRAEFCSRGAASRRGNPFVTHYIRNAKLHHRRPTVRRSAVRASSSGPAEIDRFRGRIACTYIQFFCCCVHVFLCCNFCYFKGFLSSVDFIFVNER